MLQRTNKILNIHYIWLNSLSDGIYYLSSVRISASDDFFLSKCHKFDLRLLKGAVGMTILDGKAENNDASTPLV